MLFEFGLDGFELVVELVGEIHLLFDFVVEFCEFVLEVGFFHSWGVMGFVVFLVFGELGDGTKVGAVKEVEVCSIGVEVFGDRAEGGFLVDGDTAAEGVKSGEDDDVW